MSKELGTISSGGRASAPELPAGGASSPGAGTAAAAETMRSVGERLAQAREQRGWTIEDVSARLKVPAPKLRALEAGDLTQLPGSTFAIGIVRSYAMMVGIDAEPLTKALRAAAGPSVPDMSLPASSGGGLPRGRGSAPWDNGSRSRPWFWGIAVVVLIAVALVLWRNAQAPDSWLARLRERAAQVPGSASAASSAAAALNAGSDSSDGAPISQGASAALVPMPRPAAMSGAGAGLDAVSSALAGTASMAPTPAATATGPAPAGGQANAFAAPVGIGQASLQFEMSQDSWVGVRDSTGKQIYSGLVHAGAKQQVNGTPPLKVTIGNRAGLASLEMNGKPVDGSKFPASRGNVARFDLP
jgi:cytoskeleton protein RodZ